MPNRGERVEQLRRALDHPIFNKVIKKWVGNGDLDYEVYLHTRTLLSLQTPHRELVTSEELMFQIVHQSQELWLKLVSHECANLVSDLDHDDLWSAQARLERIVQTQRALVQEMRILQTLTPAAYQVIRRSLGNGSGQESPGYNQVRTAAAVVETALVELLQRRGLSLGEVYAEGAEAADLLAVCEQLVDFDAAFQDWLVAHFMLVRRTIGIAKSVKALDGYPTVALPARMTQPLFEPLWEVRVEMTHAWKREGGHVPGASRDVPPMPLEPEPAPSRQTNHQTSHHAAAKRSHGGHKRAHAHEPGAE
jgi:tryptophan 2,3-dioxygenase